MTNEEFHEILDRYLNGRSTVADEKLLKAFSEDRLQKGRGIAAWSEEERIRAKSKVRQYLHDHVRRSYVKERTMKRRRWLKIAASIALIAGVGTWTYLANFAGAEAPVNYITKSTERGQKVTITLSDGSTVKLNSESSITYPGSFDGNARNVQLHGEAFFEVKRDTDKPFIVQTGELKTTVLGTSFNISAYPGVNDIKVTVATGKVQVASRQADKTLTPGQQAIYDRSSAGLTQKEVSLERFLAWRSNTIVFDDIPLSEAMKVLERWFNADISFENPQLGHCYIQGTYANENLLNILESIKFVKNIHYQIEENNKIMITGTNCD